LPALGSLAVFALFLCGVRLLEFGECLLERLLEPLSLSHGFVLLFDWHALTPHRRLGFIGVLIELLSHLNLIINNIFHN